jgi:hypothetical protein
VPEQPERLRLRLGQHERCAMLPNDLAAIASFIDTNARMGGKSAAKGKRRAEVRA